MDSRELGWAGGIYPDDVLMRAFTVTPLQAHYLAGLVAEAQKAQRVANEAVALLTLGHVPAGAVLQDINTDTGTLTFTVLEPETANAD